MYSPVRRCQKNELSDSLAMPTAQPKTPKHAVNTQPRPVPDEAFVSRGDSTSLGVVIGTACSSVEFAIMVSEGPRDVDHRGAQDHHEDRREDAEDEREQHL